MLITNAQFTKCLRTSSEGEGRVGQGASLVEEQGAGSEPGNGDRSGTEGLHTCREQQVHRPGVDLGTSEEAGVGEAGQ